MKIDYYGDFKEWDTLINELRDDEFNLLKFKEKYHSEEKKILEETDFKELYGANNQKIRDNHVKEELKDLYDMIKHTELHISNNKRRIDFLKAMVRLKTELIRYDEVEN